MFETQSAEYLSDDPAFGAPEELSYNGFNLTIAGGDYYLTTYADYDPIGGNAQGFTVRVRTSGSDDPRNLAVVIALAQLWKALSDDSGQYSLPL